MIMGTLNNFASIYCYISFVIGAVLMLVSLAIAAMGKDDEPRNKVRFFVAKPSRKYYNYLYLGKPRRIFSNGKFLFKSADKGRFITDNLAAYGLNPRDFDNMKEGEIKEVFINLED